MEKLQKPSCKNETLYNDITKHKKHKVKELLLEAKNHVFDRYQFYAQNYNKLEMILPTTLFSEETKVALISCYGSNVEFDKVRQLILPTSKKCPYCQIDRAKEIEHYFDKSTYPEYSVYVPNLIPCCSICNKTKGTKMFNSNNERMFIHFYFDTLPDYQFLFTEFDSNFSDISSCFYISLKFSDNDPMASVIRNHFQTLDLDNMYRVELARELELFRSELEEYPLCNFEDILIMVEARYKANVKKLGLNHFKTSFYQGILSNEEFLDTLLNFCD